MGHFIPDKIKQSISQHFQLLRENRLLFAFVGTAEECIYSFPTSFGWSILGVQHAWAWMRFAFTHMDHNPKRCCSLWASCLVVTACHKQPEKELPQVQSQLRVGQQLHSLKKNKCKSMSWKPYKPQSATGSLWMAWVFISVSLLHSFQRTE